MAPGQIKRHRLSQQVEAAAKRQPRFFFTRAVCSVPRDQGRPSSRRERHHSQPDVRVPWRLFPQHDRSQV